VNKFIFGGTVPGMKNCFRTGNWNAATLSFSSTLCGSQHFVKRVIGLPGDRLKLVDGMCSINGKRLYEPYAVHDSSHRTIRSTIPSLPLEASDFAQCKFLNGP